MKAPLYGVLFYCSLQSLVGEDAHTTIEKYNADIMFFSCRGLSLDGRATDFSVEEDIVRQKMLAHSKVKVLLCAGKKFGNEYMHNLCSARDIDYIISEAPLPDEISKTVKSL